MIGFTYSSMPIGFRTISMSFLSFLSQETYPGDFLRLEVILRRSYLRKCSSWPLPSPYHQFVIFKKIPKNLNRVELETNIFRIFISLWYLPLVKFSKKIHDIRVTCPGWFNMDLPNEAFFPLSNRCYDHFKSVFYPFS